MSKKQTIVVVEPNKRVYSEAFTTPPVACPYCGGRGYFSHDGADGEYSEACPDCDGSGGVMAIVEIKWIPSNRR